jgi:large subunit ribosomal protein L3
MVYPYLIGLRVLLASIRSGALSLPVRVITFTTWYYNLLQDPGRVWPGKKMAGRMGNKRITTQNLAVVRVDTSLDLIFVRGAVPGVDDAYVLIRDAKKKMSALSSANQVKGLFEKVLPTGVDDMPFPAGTAEMAKVLPPIIEAPSYRRSPFIPHE